MVTKIKAPQPRVGKHPQLGVMAEIFWRRDMLLVLGMVPYLMDYGDTSQGCAVLMALFLRGPKKLHTARSASQ